MHAETIKLAGNILARGMTFFTAVDIVGSVSRRKYQLIIMLVM